MVSAAGLDVHDEGDLPVRKCARIASIPGHGNIGHVAERPREFIEGLIPRLGHGDNPLVGRSIPPHLMQHEGTRIAEVLRRFPPGNRRRDTQLQSPVNPGIDLGGGL